MIGFQHKYIQTSLSAWGIKSHLFLNINLLQPKRIHLCQSLTNLHFRTVGHGSMLLVPIFLYFDIEIPKILKWNCTAYLLKKFSRLRVKKLVDRGWTICQPANTVYSYVVKGKLGMMSYCWELWIIASN
jgi:hypothetical protein